MCLFALHFSSLCIFTSSNPACCQPFRSDSHYSNPQPAAKPSGFQVQILETQAILPNPKRSKKDS